MHLLSTRNESSTGSLRHALGLHRPVPLGVPLTSKHSLGFSVGGFGFIACDALKQQHEGDVYLNSRLDVLLCVPVNM